MIRGGRGAFVGMVLACGIVLARSAAAEPVTLLRSAGDAANRLDFVVLGDGYTSSELAKFATDTDTFIASMLTDPLWAEYAPYLNVYRVDVASAQSGASHPETGVMKTTAFGAAYNCAGTQRLICVDTAAVNTVLARSLSSQQRDLVLVIVNDPVYGGSGGSVAVASTHSSAVELILHEIGHTLGLLADEYTDGTCVTSSEPSAANVTIQTTRASIKWNVWIAASTPIPTLGNATDVPGLYLGAAYCTSGVYRPTFDSKMRTLSVPYYEINTEQMVKRFYNFVAPIDSYSPTASTVTVPAGGTTTFSVATPSPASHTLTTTWTIDGTAVGAGRQLVLGPTSFAAGSHVLTASVSDATTWVRRDTAAVLTGSHSWTVTGGTGSLAPGAPASLSATASGSTVTLTWTPPSSGGAPTGYVIEAGSSSGAADLAAFSTGTTATSYTAAGVGAGRYFVRVRATNPSGTGPASPEAVLAVGSSTCVSAPAPPVLGSQVGGATVTLTWTPSSGAASYVLEAGSAPGLANLVNADTGNADTVYRATGVGAGTYFVRLRAKNACGASAPSNEQTVVVR